MNALRVAGAMYVALGLGFGIGIAITLAYYARDGELPMTPFGFRSLAGGPFEKLSPEQFAVLGSALVAVCALDTIAGTWLWQGRRRGIMLGLATSVPSLLLAVGFALPILLIGILVRTALVLAGRRGAA